MKRAFVIIVHFGSIALTLDCLKSINRNQGYPETFLINNNLDPRLKYQIKKFKKVHLLTPNRNLGFAGANNLGIKKALQSGAESVILLNNDTIIPAGFIPKIMDFAYSQKKPGIVSPKIYFARGSEFRKKEYRQKDLGRVIWYAGGVIDWNNIYASHRGVDQVDNGQFEKAVETDFATGCAMLIKKDVIEKSGYFDEKYFLYFEDADYSVAAKKNGFRVVYFPGAFIWHKNAGSSQGPGSPLHRYYQTRNRLYFGFKFASSRVKLALLRESLKYLFKGGIEKKAVLDFYLNNMGKSNI